MKFTVSKRYLSNRKI